MNENGPLRRFRRPRKPGQLTAVERRRLPADRASAVQTKGRPKPANGGYGVVTRPPPETVTVRKAPVGPVTLNCPAGAAPPSGVKTGATFPGLTVT